MQQAAGGITVADIGQPARYVLGQAAHPVEGDEVLGLPHQAVQLSAYACVPPGGSKVTPLRHPARHTCQGPSFMASCSCAGQRLTARRGRHTRKLWGL